ncbi:MAG: hypothetical protein MMC33_001908 [Icmadophila ericetorum]|nr:hypothetical protein [Icmadophila ericetorum]
MALYSPNILIKLRSEELLINERTLTKHLPNIGSIHPRWDIINIKDNLKFPNKESHEAARYLFRHIKELEQGQSTLLQDYLEDSWKRSPSIPLDYLGYRPMGIEGSDLEIIREFGKMLEPTFLGCTRSIAEIFSNFLLHHLKEIMTADLNLWVDYIVALENIQTFNVREVLTYVASHPDLLQGDFRYSRLTSACLSQEKYDILRKMIEKNRYGKKSPFLTGHHPPRYLARPPDNDDDDDLTSEFNGLEIVSVLKSRIPSLPKLGGRQRGSDISPWDLSYIYHTDPDRILVAPDQTLEYIAPKRAIPAQYEILPKLKAHPTPRYLEQERGPDIISAGPWGDDLWAQRQTDTKWGTWQYPYGYA